MNGRVRIVVSGRVQGVGYRQHAVEEATRLGIGGWVRNLPDGRVETVAEGEKEAVESFLAWAKRGPKLARVAEAKVSWEPPRGEFAGFRIAR